MVSPGVKELTTFYQNQAVKSIMKTAQEEQREEVTRQQTIIENAAKTSHSNVSNLKVNEVVPAKPECECALRFTSCQCMVEKGLRDLEGLTAEEQIIREAILGALGEQQWEFDETVYLNGREVSESQANAQRLDFVEAVVRRVRQIKRHQYTWLSNESSVSYCRENGGQ